MVNLLYWLVETSRRDVSTPELGLFALGKDKF